MKFDETLISVIEVITFFRFFNISGLSFLMVRFRLRDKKTSISAKLFEFDSIFNICWFFKSWLMQKFLAHHKMCKHSLWKIWDKKRYTTHLTQKVLKILKFQFFPKNCPRLYTFYLFCTFLLIFYIFRVFYAKYGGLKIFFACGHTNLNVPLHNSNLMPKSFHIMTSFVL